MECELRYEELAEFAAGDLSAERSNEISRHVDECDICRQRLAVLRKLDATLKNLPPVKPKTEAVLKVRRAISQQIRGANASEIMTLDEVAAFLRISSDDMAEIAEELPAFELAGNIRVRRTKLIEWIEQQELNYMRSTIESDVSRSIKGMFTKGVA